MGANTVVIILALFTLIAVLGFAVFDLRNTDRAIARRETSSHTRPGLGPQV